ncbi:hypothetical protein CMO89_01050 [Candidatus Woesearchaeota archaeon]|nr:hypothetical protein [Candidatus Woesearchaeota archaeon]|tara:strand:- start:16152 stop:17165 length:1014 start_codon:yes stop_codon:yes gene_type:complete
MDNNSNNKQHLQDIIKHFSVPIVVAKLVLGPMVPIAPVVLSNCDLGFGPNIPELVEGEEDGSDEPPIELEPPREPRNVLWIAGDDIAQRYAKSYAQDWESIKDIVVEKTLNAEIWNVSKQEYLDEARLLLFEAKQAWLRDESNRKEQIAWKDEELSFERDNIYPYKLSDPDGILEKIKEFDGRIDYLFVEVHGRREDIGVDIEDSPNEYLSIEELLNLSEEDKELIRSKFDENSRILLHCCEVGEDYEKGHNTFAEALADVLGIPVYASEITVWGSSRGGTTIGYFKEVQPDRIEDVLAYNYQLLNQDTYSARIARGALENGSERFFSPTCDIHIYN